VEKYLSLRMRDVELGHIVKGRHTTIATTDNAKRHRTNRLHTYPSTTTVTKSTRQHR